METTPMATTSNILLPFYKPNNNISFPTKNPFSPFPKKPLKLTSITTSFSNKKHTTNTSNDPKKQNPFAETLNFTKKTLTFTLAATFLAAKLCHFPAKAESLVVAPPSTVVVAESEEVRRETGVEGEIVEAKEENPSVILSNLKDLLQKRLENGENDEALVVLGKLIDDQPEENEWKFVKARLLSDLGRIEEARLVFEEILAVNPLCFEALFENAVIMDRCGEGEAVMGRLEEALRLAESESKAKEARDVRFVMAQVKFLQKNVGGALRCYDELAKEDPNDFRPYFCKGMIYTLLDRNDEAKEQFDKYRELSPKKGEVEEYLRSSLSRMKLFGADN